MGSQFLDHVAQLVSFVLRVLVSCVICYLIYNRFEHLLVFHLYLKRLMLLDVVMGSQSHIVVVSLLPVALRVLVSCV